MAFEGACFVGDGGDGAAAGPDGAVVGGPGGSSSLGAGGGTSGDHRSTDLGSASAFAPDNLVTLLWSMVELGHGRGAVFEGGGSRPPAQPWLIKLNERCAVQVN